VSGRKVKSRRLSEAEREAAVEYARPLVHAGLLGDHRPEVAAAIAINELDAVKDFPRWARDFLVDSAIRGARLPGRKQGEKTTNHIRDVRWALVDDMLRTKRGFNNATERREIIQEALGQLGHSIDLETIRKGIEKGRRLISGTS
jgi:hypothetical protein